MTKRNVVLQSLFPGRDVSEIEGEFVPENQEPNQPDQEYRGEFRFVNMGPQKLRQMLAKASTENREAINLALQAWGKLQPTAFAEAGEPYRGEKRVAVVATSMRDLVSRTAPVSQITAKKLSNRGIMSDDGEPHWLGIFDFDALEVGLKELNALEGIIDGKIS